MQLCSDGHEEVCFDADKCPACKLKNQIQEADEECSAALARADELTVTIQDFEARLERIEKAGVVCA